MILNKLKKYLAVCLLPLTTAGCGMVYDDLSKCVPDDNVTLLFALKYQGADHFRQRIGTADVAVFDDEGNYVTTKHVTQADLAALQGATLWLAPGTYRIVCWGNAASHSVFSNLSAGHTLAEAALLHTHAADGVSDTDDPMYYAPRMSGPDDPEIFLLTVPAEGSVTETIDFTAAHNTVEVYVKGFSSGGTDKPEVEITSLSAAYDFLMRPDFSRSINFVQNTFGETTPDGTMACARFHTAQFRCDDPVYVHIKDPGTHEIRHTVCMKDFLADNNITLDMTDHDLIRIVVEFSDMGVSITIPDWGERPVKPGTN